MEFGKGGTIRGSLESVAQTKFGFQSFVDFRVQKSPFGFRPQCKKIKSILFRYSERAQIECDISVIDGWNLICSGGSECRWIVASF